MVRPAKDAPLWEVVRMGEVIGRFDTLAQAERWDALMRKSLRKGQHHDSGFRGKHGRH